MKHDVHAFVSVRIKFNDVEADDHKQAIEKVSERLAEIYQLLDARNMRWMPEWVTDVEFAEEISRFLVDQKECKEFRRSAWFDSSGHEVPDNGKPLPTRLAEGRAGRVIPAWEKCDNEADDELIARAKALYHAIFVADSCGPDDLPSYQATVRELERREYGATVTLAFRKTEQKNTAATTQREIENHECRAA